MKATVNRIRRRKKAASDGLFFKKESQEPGFFAETGPQPFFQSASRGIQPKCEECKDEKKSKGFASLVSEEVAEAEVPMENVVEAGGTKSPEKPAEQPCTAGSVDLTAETTADYGKEAGVLINEKKIKSKNCPECEDECVDGSGTLSLKYNVATSVALPSVPGDLTPCQQTRVKTAIEGPLSLHEQKHVSAFKKFGGTALLPIKYHG